MSPEQITELKLKLISRAEPVVAAQLRTVYSEALRRVLQSQLNQTILDLRREGEHDILDELEWYTLFNRDTGTMNMHLMAKSQRALSFIGNTEFV